MISFKILTIFFLSRVIFLHLYHKQKKSECIWQFTCRVGRVVLFSIQQFPCIWENRHCQTLNKCSLSSLPPWNYASIALNSFPNYFVMPNVIAALIMWSTTFMHSLYCRRLLNLTRPQSFPNLNLMLPGPKHNHKKGIIILYYKLILYWKIKLKMLSGNIFLIHSVLSFLRLARYVN